jgi:hypothetical protein
LEDLVLAVEGGVSVNKDSEFDLENITTDAELQERKCLTILPQVQLSLLPKWIVFFIMESIFPIMFTWQPFIDLPPPPSCYIVVPLLAVV